MFLRENYINNITSKLSWLVSEIKQKGFLKLYNDHIHAETFFCGLLNVIFDYHLKNANFSEPNAAAIDLADTINRIAVQVTTERTATKVKKTLEKFKTHGLYRQYDRLVILIVGDRPKYRATFETGCPLNFSAANDIWGIESLIEEIGRQDNGKLAQISDYLDKELIPISGYTGTNLAHIAEEMEQKALALCMVKLKSLGVPKEVANRIIGSDINGSKYQYILDSADEGKCYLVGDFGTGKSHALLILVQQLAKSYLGNLSERIPLFAQAREIAQVGSIRQWVKEQGITDTDYFLFIDGLDEINASVAKQIREEMESLLEMNPANRIIVATRPLAILQNNKQKINICEFTIDEQRQLYAMITQNPKSSGIPYVEHTIAKMLAKPFFCILFSLFKEEPQSWAKTDMDLVAAFIDRTITACGEDFDATKHDLCRIAAKSVDANLDSVHISSVRLENSLASLLKTGLIIQIDTFISFPLPIIAQWLAADAICQGFANLDDIIADKCRTNRWMYALSILFSQMSYEESLKYFSKIVQTMPGVAARIIRDGIRFDCLSALPTPHECGRMLQECMQVWVDGLGPLSQYIAPVQNGKLLPLGIWVEHGYITYSWSNCLSHNSVSALSYSELLAQGCKRIHSRSVQSQATWPWIVTFETLSDNLKCIIEDHGILIDGQLKDEFLWNAALHTTGKGSLYEGEIDLRCFPPYNGQHGILLAGGKEFSIEDIDAVVNEYKNAGITQVKPPYPLSDKRGQGGAIWKQYSKKRYIEKISFVYETALRVYMDLVNTVFLTLRDDLCIAQLYPCKLVGGLKFPDGGDWAHFGPNLTHYWEALPYGEEAYIDIQVREIPFSNPDYFHRICLTNESLRPEFRIQPATTMSSGWVDVFGPMPVTDMVFSWLNDELKELGWIRQDFNQLVGLKRYCCLRLAFQLSIAYCEVTPPKAEPSGNQQSFGRFWMYAKIFRSFAIDWLPNCVVTHLFPM